MDKKKLVSSKNDVTLLLTIYNRREFTLRWIDFIEKFNCPFNIYISDGGNDKYLQRKLENIAKKNKKITYKKFAYYRNYKKLFEKFYLSTKEIKTRYTYLCEDDDFLIFENIKKSENFLNKNKSYSCSGGQSYNIEILKKNFLCGRKEHFQKNISYTDNSKFNRILQLLNNMQSNWNCLHRTKDINRIFYLTNKIIFRSYLETELLFILSSFYFGKTKRFNHVEYIKIDNTEFSSSENFSLNNDYLKIISSKSYSDENYAFIHFFKKNFSKKKILIIEEVLNNFLTKANKERFDKIYPSFRKKINDFLRLIIKNILQTLNLFNLIKINFIKIAHIKTDKNFYNKTMDIHLISKKDINFFRKLRVFLKN
tara:strand:- start:117 stop:1220 length:1104 start_codon:yes stop_codon:yes gene_type:complete